MASARKEENHSDLVASSAMLENCTIVFFSFRSLSAPSGLTSSAPTLPCLLASMDWFGSVGMYLRCQYPSTFPEIDSKGKLKLHDRWKPVIPVITCAYSPSTASKSTVLMPFMLWFTSIPGPLMLLDLSVGRIARWPCDCTPQ